MGKSKLQIPKACIYCGKAFLAKTIKTVYCSRICAWSACNEKRKTERKQKVLDKIKATGTEYITITEALGIFTTSRNTVHRLLFSKKIHFLKISPKRVFVCVKDLEALFPLRTKPVMIENKEQSHIFNMDPKHCYTIGEISKRFNVSEKSVYTHIRRNSIPTRQIGNYVYAPKKEIEKIYANKNSRK